MLRRLFDQTGFREHPQMEADAVGGNSEVRGDVGGARMPTACDRLRDAPPKRVRIGLEHRRGRLLGVRVRIPGIRLIRRRVRVRIRRNSLVCHAAILSTATIAQY
jgi:hypothetical protein